jgi:hypothetical protein
VSRTRTVAFGDRYFWTYDVSLSIMLAEAIWVGQELQPGQRPEWLPDALEKLRVLAERHSYHRLAIADAS